MGFLADRDFSLVIFFVCIYIGISIAFDLPSNSKPQYHYFNQYNPRRPQQLNMSSPQQTNSTTAAQSTQAAERRRSSIDRYGDFAKGVSGSGNKGVHSKGAAFDQKDAAASKPGFLGKLWSTHISGR